MFGGGSQMRIFIALGALLLAVFPQTSHGHSPRVVQRGLTPIISDIKLMKESGIKILTQDEKLGVGYAVVTPEQAGKITAKAHEYGRCGGYEALPSSQLWSVSLAEDLFSDLRKRNARNAQLASTVSLEHRPQIEKAIAQVSEENLKTWVQWFSAYPTRYNKAKTANDHVDALKLKIEAMIKESGVRYPVAVDLITHTSTPQKSIRVTLTGSQRPSEVVVLGGHMDSINQDWFSFNKKAPGADDNASGSANLLETLRILLTNPQPQRSIEFMWYAGEESGLLGSAEIARTYKQKNVDVVGVLQLDMTLFPGDGELTLSSMTDFTSIWMRGILVEINRLYIKANLIESACGYGCSDHASWYRQGYPTLMPHEASMKSGNSNIHTERDVVDGNSNFRHSAAFTKIALALALELGNSTLHE